MIDSSLEINRQQDLIRSRRSIRRFLPRAVPEDLVTSLLESATCAPSSHNRQPWRFVILSTKETREQLVEKMGALFRKDLLADGIPEVDVEQAVLRARSRVLTAPVAILVCLDKSLGDTYPDKQRQAAEYIMGVQSVAMAGCTLLLAAHGAGLGGVWLCAPLFVPELVRSVLDLPTSWEPQGLVLLGYPAKIPESRPRKSVNEVSRHI